MKNLIPFKVILTISLVKLTMSQLKHPVTFGVVLINQFDFNKTKYSNAIHVLIKVK